MTRQVPGVAGSWNQVPGHLQTVQTVWGTAGVMQRELREAVGAGGEAPALHRDRRGRRRVQGVRATTREEGGPRCPDARD